MGQVKQELQMVVQFDGQYTLTYEKFNNISEFVEIITNRQNGPCMQGQDNSHTNSEYFTGTQSYEEAKNFLEYGHKESAEKLTLKIGSVKKQYETQGKRIKSEYSVVGHQASVPRYLQGIPQNMIQQKRVPMKQKVVKLYKSMAYSASTNKDTIFEQSAKALIIVEKLEQMGYRVELDLVWMSKKMGKASGMTITLKKSSERLNISKLAFPMVHPSMLRRIGFRWMETTPCVKSTKFQSGYGEPVNTVEYMSKVFKDGYILPGFIDDPQELINSWKL